MKNVHILPSKIYLEGYGCCQNPAILRVIRTLKKNSYRSFILFSKSDQCYHIQI